MSEIKTLAEIHKEEQDSLSELLDSTGSFFAFTSEQFNKYKKEGVDYTYASDMKLYIPTQTVDEFIRLFAEIDTESKKHKSRTSMDEYILDCLKNYEAFYTYELDEAFDETIMIFPHCTMEDVKRVFDANNKEEEE